MKTHHDLIHNNIRRLIDLEGLLIWNPLNQHELYSQSFSR